MEKLNGLDLFSGIGGLSLALEPWVQTVAYCERDTYAQSVLLSRMLEGSLDAAPIWDDVSTLRGDMLPRIDIIFGGFPCQDISVAGRGEGLAGKRSGLFFEVARLVQEISPSFVFLENVPAIRTRGGETVVKTLASLGYDCRWTTLSAASVGACHIRERWFLLAHASGERRQQVTRSPHGDESENEGRRSKNDHIIKRAPQKTLWDTCHAELHGVANGVPFRVDRLRCLGNAVVPLQAQEAFKELAGLK